MLTMTSSAVDAVTTIVSNVPDAAEGGVRISDSQTGEGFQLAVVPAPLPDDTVIVAGGARVFLDSAASASLDDRILDAQQEPDGGVRFALGNQS